MVGEETFRDELAALINKYSLENVSDTPDFLLADYLQTCLLSFDIATRLRDGYGHEHWKRDEVEATRKPTKEKP